MVDVGEKSGSISRVLERTADYYERKVDAAITTLMTLLEPIMIITVGCNSACSCDRSLPADFPDVGL